MKHKRDQRLKFYPFVLQFLWLTLMCLILIVTNVHAGSYVAVGRTLNRMLHSPDQFCEYIDAHQAVFNKQFENCVNHNIEWREDKIAEIWEKCTDLYGTGDDRTACFEQDNEGLELENQVSWLEIMLSITNNGADCTLVDDLFGWLVDEWDPDITGMTWEEWWDSALPQMESAYACKVSDDDTENWWEDFCFISSVSKF